MATASIAPISGDATRSLRFASLTRLIQGGTRPLGPSPPLPRAYLEPGVYDVYVCPRHSCSRGWTDYGERRCIAFGGLRVDDAIEDALLTVVGPGAIAAAVSAETEAAQRRDQVREALERDLEAARFAADRAFRQYDAADPPTGLSLANWRRAGTRRSSM